MTIKITPSAQLVRTLAAQPLTHAKALAEWIDNAIDAGAKTVEVVFGSKGGRPFVRVTDDGCGTANMETFVRFGDSNSHKTTRSGIYGIGAKDAALWYGGESSLFRVESTHGGRVREVRCDWQSVIRNDWGIEDPTDVPAVAGANTGTTIFVCPARRPPDGQQWGALLERLGYIYTPALRDGVQIKLRRGNRGDWDLLRPWSRPEMVEDSVIDTVVDVGGKRARVVAGLVPDGVVNRRPGLTYFHGFRVIKEASSRGCGNAEIRRICGFVQIDNGWRRTKNKDDLVNADALYEAVQVAIQPLLDRAEAEGMQVQHAAFTKEVAARLNVAIAKNAAKAKRGKGAKRGTVKPTGNGSRHTQAANVQPGDRFPGPFPGGTGGGSFRIAWGRLGERVFGRVCGRTVELNEDCPIVAQAITDKNVLTTTTLAFAVVAYDESRRDRAGQGLLKIDGVEDRDVHKILSALLWDAQLPSSEEAATC